MKWTQEQREKGYATQVEVGLAVFARKHMVAQPLKEEVLLELACQRNELLWALKNLLALVEGECPSVLRDDHHYDMVTNAIEKAEGK